MVLFEADYDDLLKNEFSIGIIAHKEKNEKCMLYLINEVKS